MGEKDVEWFECYEERWNWRFEDGEEQLAMPPETTVKS